MNAFLGAALAALTLGFASSLAAQDVRIKRVTFPSGASGTVMEGRS